MEGDGKKPAKIKRKDFQVMACQYSRYSVKEIQLAKEQRNKSVIIEIAEELSDEVCRRIKARELGLPPIRFFKRIDGISLKEREISHESPLQQVFDAVTVEALQPLFKAKVMPYQCASIRGRGQVRGKRAIERWLRRKKLAQYYVKGDVKSCFKSIKKKPLMQLLRRDIHKNPVLLWLISELLDTYYMVENGVIIDMGLVIGTLLSQWLCNYAMSYLYRYMDTLTRVRNGKRGAKTVRLVRHLLFYMDDILALGKRAADLKSAMVKASRWAKKYLGITIKDTWQVISTAKNSIDMMGYVVGYRHTVIRARIFIRARRQFLRAERWLRKNKRLSLRRARSVVCYAGYFMHSDSTRICAKLDFGRIFKIAKRDVSYYSAKLAGRKGAQAA